MSNRIPTTTEDVIKNAKVLRCSVCGTITHKVERTLFGKKKTPLTIQGQSVRGVCLVCHGPHAIQHAVPLTAEAVVVPQPTGVPKELLVKAPDDATVVSAITLDHRLDAPDESDEESGHFRVVPGQRRPEPSLGDPDEYERPAPLRRSRQDSLSQLQQSQQHQQRAAPQPSMMEEAFSATNSSSLLATTGASGISPPPALTSPTNNLMGAAQQQQRQQHQYTSGIQLGSGLGQMGQIYEHAVMAMHSPPGMQSATFAAHRQFFAERSPSFEDAYGVQEEKTEIEQPSEGLMHAAGWTMTNISENTTTFQHQSQFMDYESNPLSYVGHSNKLPAHMTANMPRHIQSRTNSLADIPSLVGLLNTENGDHLTTIQTLAAIVWEYGQPAKVQITQRQGLEGLTQAMWASMADPSVPEAALNLIFALVVSSDGLDASDVFIGQSAQDVVDALLIVMQTHLTVETIQQPGIGTLACLAAASGSNPRVDDASLSGALVTVVGAMEAHRNSKGIQEWGIRALYNQCVYSRNAESNKRSLAKYGLEENKCGAAVIYRAIEISEADMVTVEWACRLYWCLAASEDVAEFLTVTHHPIHVILEALQRYHQVKQAGNVLVSVLGALANLVKVRDNHKVVDSSVLFLVVKAAQTQPNNEDLLTEAFALIANLVSFSSANAAVAVSADVFDVIFSALQTFPDSTALFEEAMRTLTSLCIASENAKGYLCTPDVLSFLSQATNKNGDSAYGQEMLIQLIASVMTRKEFQSAFIDNGGLDMLLSAMRAHSNDRRVQEAACLAVRNLTCHGDDMEQLDIREAVHVVAEAMNNHSGSESIQINGCCVFWNAPTSSRASASNPYNLSDIEVIRSIVKAMQTHMESTAVLEMACGALCSKISNCLVGQQHLVEVGGLDAVTCVLVMHPNASAALEKALGVLSTMSANQSFADEVADAQCMSNVVEAMRANSKSIALLEFGCLVLRNIILMRPEHAPEATSVVATILNSMQEHPDAICFQREACSLLWAMTAVSAECKSKVLSLDGIAVLLNCLEHNSSLKDVQDAALGAFNQLSSAMGG